MQRHRAVYGKRHIACMLSLEKDAGGAMHGTDRPVHAWIQNGVRHPPYSGTDRNGAITHRIQRSQPEGLKAADMQQYVCPGMQKMRLPLINHNATAATARITPPQTQQSLFQPVCTFPHIAHPTIRPE